MSVEVSVIIPCFNEAKTIGKTLDALYQQTYPREQMEVIIADGISTDNTRDIIAQNVKKNIGLKVMIVDNPRRIIPAGLNLAIIHSTGSYIIRMDGHSLPAPNYVQKCVSALGEGKGENVGGVWVLKPGGTGWIARSIAAAGAHPLGVGDALYRYTQKAGYVDTVPFGAIKRELLDKIGYYNETLQTNEDYELNARIRKMGGRIWLDPAIKCAYFARSTITKLAAQYFRYGYWKVRMLHHFPETIRLRQGLPPLFVLTLVLLLICSLFYRNMIIALTLIIGIYTVILLLTGLIEAFKQKDVGFIIGIPVAIATMHIAWGSGFLWSGIKLIFRIRESSCNL